MLALLKGFVKTSSAIALTVGMARGDILTVAQDGSGDYTSLQEAINAATEGDELRVFPGTWDGPYEWSSKMLVIKSELGLDQTILSGNGLDRAMRVSLLPTLGGVPSRLEGFTIRDGVLNDPNLIANESGAGLLVENSQLQISNCSVTQNYVWTSRAASWSSDYWTGAAGVTILGSSTVEFEECEISENTSRLAFTSYGSNGGVRGAGLHVDGSSYVTLNACTIERNVTLGESFAPNCLNCSLSGGYGAGIWLGENSYVHAQDTSISDNTCAGVNATYAMGGGIWTSGILSLQGVEINGNTCDASINCYCGTENSSGGAIYVDGGSTTIMDCTLWSNSAVNAHENYGGGAYVNSPSGTVSISSSSFCSNTPPGIEGAWQDAGMVVQHDLCLDCNGNGVVDLDDLTAGTMSDCDQNYVPDECAIAADPSLDLNGNAELDSCECYVSNYCLAQGHSSGGPASMVPIGTPSLSVNSFGVMVQGAPGNMFGLFFYAGSQGFTLFGEGALCVGPPVFRLNPVLLTDSNGEASRSLDFNQAALANLTSLSTWNFQFWYRDPNGGPAGFNLSDGLEVTFCP